MAIKQRPSQTPAFWQSEFQITEETIESLYNSFLEIGEPRSIDDISLFVVQETLEAEERAIRAELQQGKLYRPDQHYELNDKLVFPRFEYAIGTVVGIRDGHNPYAGDFTVLEVEFAGPPSARIAVAADLKAPHVLSTTDGKPSGEEEGPTPAQKLYAQFQHIIRPRVEEALRARDDFVEFNHRWFLADLLVEVQEGLLNIVDAAIDISGTPQNVDAIIEQIELQKDGGSITDTLRFSVNYRLTQDPRFINVGTEDRVLWFLNRLKPIQVEEVPHNLRINPNMTFDPEALPPDLRTLLMEIDDEATPPQYARPADPQASEAIFVLTYPHRRSGTLPVLPTLRPMLPETNGRLVALQFIDGQTGDPILVWLVSEHNYLFGLGDWFETYKLPVGAFIILRKTEAPLKFIVDYIPQRTQREWVRVATVQNNQLVFQMKKRALSCRYDELMVIGEEGSEAIDTLWVKAEQKNVPLAQLLTQIFPELMKLTSQSAVHVKTLYSAINVMRRCPPGVLLQELNNHPGFVWMGHGYWTYKPSPK